MIWTREVGQYGSPHTHVLLHVPLPLTKDGTFQCALERSLEPEGSPIHDKAILIQPAYRPLGKLLYNLKGVDPRDAKEFGIRAAFHRARASARCLHCQKQKPIDGSLTRRIDQQNSCSGGHERAACASGTYSRRSS